MTTERPRKTVLATVTGKGETKQRGLTLELNIPSFESKYPVLITNVKKEQLDQLETGKQYNLVLERQNLGKDKDGSKFWHYYWGFVGVAAADAKVEPVKEARADIDYYADKKLSIHRQKAVELALISGENVNWVQIFQRANRIIHFLETGLDMAQKPTPAPAPEVPAGVSGRAQTASVAPGTETDISPGPKSDDAPRLLATIQSNIHQFAGRLGLITVDARADWRKANMPKGFPSGPAASLTREQQEELEAALYKAIQDKAAKKLEQEQAKEVKP